MNWQKQTYRVTRLKTEDGQFTPKQPGYVPQFKKWPEHLECWGYWGGGTRHNGFIGIENNTTGVTEIRDIRGAIK